MQEATLSVVTVNTVQPTFVQLNTFARVTISTFGSQPRDVVKFVPSAAECESAAYAEYLLGNQQVVNVLFTDASIEKYYLCYKPVDEAFTFLEVFSLTVRDDRNLIDFASTKHHFSVVGETEEYEIMEDNVAEGDRVMWSVDGCASSVADTTEMAVHDRKFTMTFGEVFANASLCMKFVGTRSWTEYPNQKLSVLSCSTCSRACSRATWRRCRRSTASVWTTRRCTTWAERATRARRTASRRWRAWRMRWRWRRRARTWCCACRSACTRTSTASRTSRSWRAAWTHCDPQH